MLSISLLLIPCNHNNLIQEFTCWNEFRIFRLFLSADKKEDHRLVLLCRPGLIRTMGFADQLTDPFYFRNVQLWVSICFSYFVTN